MSAGLPLSTTILLTSQFDTFRVRTNASSCGRLRFMASLLWNMIECSTGLSGSIHCGHHVSTKHRASANDPNGLPDRRWRWHIFNLLYYPLFLRLVVEPICLSSILCKELPKVSLIQQLGNFSAQRPAIDCMMAMVFVELTILCHISSGIVWHLLWPHHIITTLKDAYALASMLDLLGTHDIESNPKISDIAMLKRLIFGREIAEPMKGRSLQTLNNKLAHHIIMHADGMFVDYTTCLYWSRWSWESNTSSNLRKEKLPNLGVSMLMIRHVKGVSWTPHTRVLISLDIMLHIIASMFIIPKRMGPSGSGGSSSDEHQVEDVFLQELGSGACCFCDR
ncbi:hypothetical protein TIFTF001_028609 [Ficus carica]|uniref:Uncharacterized protein n=1 Tax=Ficus carica TaxID=3494 RepID=A0AA88DQD6_FICCA|nr:hypothetical protein TIFTF001_028609 [Ficus carica]